MLVRKYDREGQSAHQHEADGPSRIQIEPAPRHELETQVAVDQPRGESASHYHRERVDNGDQDGRAEIGVDEGACRLVASVEFGGPAEIGTSISPAPCAIATAKDQSPSCVGRIRASARGWRRLTSRKIPKPITSTLAPIWICCCHSTRVTSSPKGRSTTSIASRWPTDSGQSAATRARELLSISRRKRRAATPSPG